MRIDVANQVTTVTLMRGDLLHVGLRDADWWIPMGIQTKDLAGDSAWRALKIDFDLRSLYQGSDGAFYVIQALGANRIVFGDLTLTRVPQSTCEEDL